MWELKGSPITKHNTVPPNQFLVHPCRRLFLRQLEDVIPSLPVNLWDQRELNSTTIKAHHANCPEGMERVLSLIVWLVNSFVFFVDHLDLQVQAVCICFPLMIWSVLFPVRPLYKRRPNFFLELHLRSKFSKYNIDALPTLHN